MAETTKIQWCDMTFNPWIGCAKVSPGCEHCYAETLNRLHKWTPGWAKGVPRHRTSEATWKQPLKWNIGGNEWRECPMCGHRGYADMESNRCRECETDLGSTPLTRPRVFCGSCCDWLDDEVPAEWLADLLELIDKCRNLDFLLLTKRPENWKSRMEAVLAIKRVGSHGGHCLANRWLNGHAPTNVCIMTTVENQPMADNRIPELLRIPANVRGLSCEPLLGAVNLAFWLGTMRCMNCGFFGFEEADECPKCGASRDYEFGPIAFESGLSEEQKASGIHWVICGGESGPKARPIHPDWARSLRDQCAAAGVPFFFKQWGEWAWGPDYADSPKAPRKDWQQVFDSESDVATMYRVGKKAAGRLLDGREHNEFPIK